MSFGDVGISERMQVSKVVRYCLEFEMKKSSDLPRRWLRFEALEPRAMMAGDLVELHNFIMPEDCDNSGSVSPLDALMVINSLNQPNSGTAQAARFIDVDADGRTSPLDALVVINYLNAKSPDAPSMPSSVRTENRIARIEAALANFTLPPNMDVMAAQEILDTLKAGGRPEVGERLMEGRILERSEVQRVENERSAILVADRIDDDHRDKAISERIEGFVKRLTEAGVTASVVTTISSEIKAGFDAKQPLTLDQIKSRLTELGVDVSKIFPPPRDQDPRDAVEHEHRGRLEAFAQRLRNAGVTEQVVSTIVIELKASIEAGNPLSLDQIKSRLTELGVDVSKLFPVVRPPVSPPPPTEITPPIGLVTMILNRFQVPAATIEIVTKAMTLATEEGKPLTARQIIDLLRENGVEIPAGLERWLRR